MSDLLGKNRVKEGRLLFTSFNSKNLDIEKSQCPLLGYNKGHMYWIKEKEKRENIMFFFNYIEFGKKMD